MSAVKPEFTLNNKRGFIYQLLNTITSKCKPIRFLMHERNRCVVKLVTVLAAMTDNTHFIIYDVPC